MISRNCAAIKDAAPPADAAAAVAPAAWLADFHEELKRVLLAELDLRLQPTVGLIEALRNEVA